MRTKPCSSRPNLRSTLRSRIWIGDQHCGRNTSFKLLHRHPRCKPHFFGYLFAILFWQLSTGVVAYALQQTFSQQVYVPKRIGTDEATAINSPTRKKLPSEPGNETDLARLESARTIGMVVRSHQKLKQILKKSHWDRHVKFAIIAQETKYHQSLKYRPNEFFRRRIPYIELENRFQTNDPTRPRKLQSLAKHSHQSQSPKFDWGWKKRYEDAINIVQENYHDRKASAQPVKVPPRP